MNSAWWLAPSIVLGIAAWCFILGIVGITGAILIVLAFGAGIWWAAWWLIYVNGR